MELGWKIRQLTSVTTRYKLLAIGCMFLRQTYDEQWNCRMKTVHELVWGAQRNKLQSRVKMLIRSTYCDNQQDAFEESEQWCDWLDDDLGQEYTQWQCPCKCRDNVDVTTKYKNRLVVTHNVLTSTHTVALNNNRSQAKISQIYIYCDDLIRKTCQRVNMMSVIVFSLILNNL